MPPYLLVAFSTARAADIQTTALSWLGRLWYGSDLVHCVVHFPETGETCEIHDRIPVSLTSLKTFNWDGYTFMRVPVTARGYANAYVYAQRVAGEQYDHGAYRCFPLYRAQHRRGCIGCCAGCMLWCCAPLLCCSAPPELMRESAAHRPRRWICTTLTARLLRAAGVLKRRDLRFPYSTIGLHNKLLRRGGVVASNEVRTGRLRTEDLSAILFDKR